MNDAVITQALEFSTEVGLGGGGENQGQKLISNKQERIKWGHCLDLYMNPLKKDISDKNLGVTFTRILSVISQSFEETPQTFN